ncbi:hypothetical protein BegalDRAFT_1562 [Beggiatoa alba B18LD]|uniref:Uncharacterized protein n=1 Tax=Beggiatoa alba B18LD TaxID=395493 RepID=I3CFQ0_9GAMM|nr:hypothetical protein BegalDRAFT_1562 [Beggiatoa alba B18LD]
MLNIKPARFSKSSRFFLSESELTEFSELAELAELAELKRFTQT